MYSINKTGTHVDAKRLSDNTNANDQASAESINHSSNGASKTSLVQGIPYLAKELKELISVKDLMESDGHQFKQSGRSFMCRCPFHADRTPSFSVKDEHTSTGKCFGCGWWRHPQI